MNELTQLHGMTIFIPMDTNKLTREYKIKALSSLMFLAGKQYGTIKARTCTDGSKQRSSDSYNKHYYSSPTCTNNSVMITATLEAK